jgi:hypothetical protein
MLPPVSTFIKDDSIDEICHGCHNDRRTASVPTVTMLGSKTAGNNQLDTMMTNDLTQNHNQLENYVKNTYLSLKDHLQQNLHEAYPAETLHRHQQDSTAMSFGVSFTYLSLHHSLQ